MQVILTSIVAVAGTLLGSCLTYFLQRQIGEETSVREPREERRRELLEAVDGYSLAVTRLRRAEHDRAKKRLNKAAADVREDARQETYRLRSDAWSAYYRLRLRADPHVLDDEFLSEAEGIIELTRQITAHTATEAEMAERSSLANKALKAFVDLAGQRIRNESPSGPAKRVGNRDARSSGGC